MHYAGQALLFFISFLIDMFLAGMTGTFSFAFLRFVVYLSILRNPKPATMLLGGSFLLLSSFVLYDLVGADSLLFVLISFLLYIAHATFDNHVILQILLALICSIAHGFILTLFA